MFSPNTVTLITLLFLVAGGNGFNLPFLTKLDLPTSILQPKESTCESTVNKLLETFRKLMPTGSSLLGIRKLEPLEYSHLNINITHEIGSCAGTMDSVVVENLSTFIVDKIECRYSMHIPRRVIFNLTIPFVNFTGLYDLEGLAMQIIPMYGKGPFSMNITGLHIDVDASISMKTKSALPIAKIKELRMTARIDKFNCFYTGLMGGGEYEEMFNRMFTDIGPEALDILWPEIEPIVTKKILGLLDPAKANAAVNDLVYGMFMMPSQLMG